MKRLAGIIGVLGAVGAIIWAIRDRLVSVAIPREPRLPGFRVPERADPTVEEGTSGEPPAGTGTREPVAGGVTDVSGVGPVYATRLEAGGVATLADLAQGDAAKIAEAAEVSEGRARGWIESAQSLLEG